MHQLLWLCGIILVLPDTTTSQSWPNSLRLNQRYPNKDESEVCGRIRDVIPRDSGRFRKILIRNTNDLADYANDDCRRMTSRTKSKLDILASRVRSTWGGGVKLRVLRAWTDQIDPSDRTSLHYEGRSVHIQLSNGDRNKLGRLAGLALEAGFDWVHYANHNYIRASVIPDVCQTSVDLVFLLDESGSVGAGNFRKVKEFVQKVVDFFNVGRTGTHISVVTYSTHTKLHFTLKKYFTKLALRNAVSAVNFGGGWTYTGEALDFLLANVFTKAAGMRDDAGVPKVLVLLTDGKSNGKNALGPANALRNKGINIFSIGVGSGVSVKELNLIASDPDKDYVFHLGSFNALSHWVDRLSSVSCSEGSLIKSCDKSVTSVTSGSFKYFRTEFKFASGQFVSVELRDTKGISHLYASSTSKNPGPLDPDSVKNENDRSPRAVSVRLNAAKTVYVAVQGQKDTNEFSLSFWDNLFLQSTSTVTVNEGPPNTRLVTALRLTLAATTYNLGYSITDGNHGGFFRIKVNKNRPEIHTTKELDREAVSEYNLVVVAQDAKNKCHKSRTLVVVTVGDINDNNPVFTKDPYTSNIKENAQIGSVLETVKATDKDVGVNAQITYSIESGNTGNLFAIHNDGRVTLQGALDYEKNPVYSLIIKAVDGGNPRRWAKAVLNINVVDVNERPSIRCDGSCVRNVFENSGISVVGKVIGSDPDSLQCSLKYDIPSSAKSTFQVSSGGVIKTSKGLDREATPQYVFYVRVQDCGSPPLVDSVRVTVIVGDRNDNDPTFSGPYHVGILENEARGSNVVQVKADDADTGINGEVRYSLSGAESSGFNIDDRSGRITTKTTLDFEKKQSYTFTVTATDQGAGRRTGTTTVTVNVKDVNDNKPSFIGSPYKAQVKESATTGTVKTVKATDADSGINSEIRYSITSGNIGNVFAMDSNSGRITVNSKLDRETRSLYKLMIQASDRGSPSLTSHAAVDITILDVNDNSPIFHGIPYSASVPENKQVNQLILKVSATDKDSGSFGRITYSIESPSIAQQTFKINANGNILLKQANLDYETKKSYSFLIAATDGGGRKSTTNVDVLIEDYNDNAPVFGQNPYLTSVAEDVDVGYLVGVVKATDKDSGPRGRVTYSILTSGNVGGAFRISTAGSVIVAASMDRETRETYTLTIKASDEGIPSLYSTTKMVITVTDINDNKPTFDKSSYSFKISENNAPNTEVGKIGPATDKDKGVNAEIVYSIIRGDPSGTFRLGAKGELIAKIRLDREKTSSYNLIVKAKDKGSSPLSTQVPVEVIVDDENDNVPEFSPKTYDCEISENSAKNTPVCFVRASDKDAGQNGVVMYELTRLSTYFSVDQNNGEIKAKVTFDREQKASYSFEVRAEDGGSPAKSSTARVNVKVIDKNDNEPVFKRAKYSFDVSEDVAVRTKIGQVVADDKDEGLNGQVVHSIIKGNTNTAFEIDATTGDIKVKSLLDREKLASYKLNVRAVDRGTPSLFSSRNVLVTVKDVNDNDPIFTQAIYHGIIAEDASIGSAVVQVKANDPDEGNNGKITYTLTGGQSRSHFSIDGDTGLIRTASALDYETISSYLLDVTASDAGNPPRSTSSRVNITITNTNDNIPTFVAGSPTVSISEGVAIGTNVVKFNATDKDGSVLTFSISSGNTDDALKLDSKTGLLTTNKKLDRETIPRYNLTITVTDNGGQSSSRNLSVIVLDVNDNAPKFEPSSYQEQITENTPAGSVVTVKATDKDEGKNAKISFSIDPTSTTKFTIDITTGVISSKNALDHENGARYIIEVTAKDAGTPSLSSVATVEVIVVDTNDNSPNFNDDYSTTLPENTVKGKTVLRVEATDPDSGVNGEIQYSITSGNNDGYFSLDINDGNLKVEKPPDRETNPSFTLTVRASNKVPLIGSITSTKTSCIVKITIEDLNDNAPNITNNVLMLNIRENSKHRTPVFDVHAVDKDAGNNGVIQYDIVSGIVKNAFAIDLVTGQVTVNGLLDRETIDRYILKIRASDKGTPSLFSDKDFTVNITDEDDNPPVFEGTPYDASVSENANIPTLVFRVKATDKDIGANGNIRYSIHSGNDQRHFKMDPASGELFTNALLDYEKVKNYDLVVSAKDTTHTSQENLRVRVVNINDNNPVFNPDRYNVSVKEDTELYKQFLILAATDKDPFGSLSYTIVSGNNDKKFSLDSGNGQLHVASQLDRETTDYYNLTVLVTDGGKPTLSDLGFVEIHITDSNDNAPKFDSLLKQGTVLENSPVGVTVLRVNATDSDLGVNAKIKYTITKGNEQSMFKLDADTGDLDVNANIDRENISYFHLNIVAKDQGLPPLTSQTLHVEIRVLDENDNNPEFTKDNYMQNITENLSGGTFVEQIEATDKDFELNGKVMYSFKSGAYGHFVIGSESGIVETVVPLDRENVSFYRIVIEARDLGTPSRNSTVSLYVNVLDANDNAPEFVNSSLQGNATEEEPSGQFVTRIRAVDGDEGRNAEIEYKLATQRANTMLRIDPKTGEIRTRVRFDYEEQQVYKFKVTATDKGNPSLSTTADLTVNIIDVDDHCPVFNPKEYNVTIQENLPLNHTIVRVYATDKDSADNKDLDYGIRSGNQAGTIAIDSVTGELKPSADIDREYSTVYSLIVRAGSDFCGVNASGTVDETTIEKLSNSICNVNIFVTDVNDNPPKFHKASYSHVFSDIYQTNVLSVNATDPDAGVNAEVDFGLAGVERVNSKRTLTVKATDRGLPSQASNTTLAVTMANGMSCEAMLFDVSPRGYVTVKTLCIFEKVEIVGAALVGEAIKLDCIAKGNTVPEYRWTRDSVPVTDWLKTGAYEIKALTKDDAGRYSCIASSEAGTILSDPIALTVKEPPTITVHPKDTWAGIDERAVLHCLATGDLPMEYTWYKHNEKLHSTGDLVTDRADLVFERIIPEDAEEYYCEAKNRVKDEPARSKKALLQVYSADSVVEMDVRVDKPRHKESCQYFNTRNVMDALEKVVEGKVVVTEFVKPNTTCNVTRCSSDPCKNQGKCQTTGLLCQCPRGWTGQFCEKDEDECKTESCGNGTCQNRQGSYSCDCKTGTSGKRCQLEDVACKPNPCTANQTCYPKETLEGYECIDDVKTVTMVVKLDESRRPWEDWMKYDIAREIENSIENRRETVVRQRSEGNRRRRNVVGPDYSACSVLIQNANPIGGKAEVQLEAVLVCSIAPSKSYVCRAMIDEGRVSSCTGDSGPVTEIPPTQPPTIEPVRLTVVFFVRASDGKEVEASSTISVLKESDVDDTALLPHGIKILAFRERSPKQAKKENADKISTGAIAGVAVAVIVISLVVIAICILVIRGRKQDEGKFSIQGRAVLSRTTSSQAMLTQDISLRDLKTAETRGMNNRTFSEIYEESDDVPKELEDGAFMVDNPQLALRNQRREYMKELESSPWYHGSISRSKAEELLDDEDNEGSFIVRAGLDEGEFYISVRARQGGPKFRHIAVNRRDESFVAVCGAQGDTVEYATFHELVEYLRSTPTRTEGVGSDIQLKDYVEKK